jgi:hypothetical protein
MLTTKHTAKEAGLSRSKLIKAANSGRLRAVNNYKNDWKIKAEEQQTGWQLQAFHNGFFG